MSTATSSPSSTNPLTPQEQDPTTEPSKTQNPNQEAAETTQETVKQQTLGQKEAEKAEEAEEDEGECGFCLFMKGGECKKSFINWEKCVEEGEKNGEDIVDKCFEATSALKKCMEANVDYYGVILQAEKDAEQEVNDQLDQQNKESVVADESNESEKKQEQEQEQV